jgi:hypothetical protein
VDDLESAVERLQPVSGSKKESIVTHDKATRGMRVFLVVWLGQVVSVVGSGLTSFALGLWVYERTGSVTPYALTGLFAVLPSLVLSMLAGVLVDQWDRRRVMVLGDTGAGLATLAMALLFLTGRVQVWHIYLATAVSAAFSTFQRLAYTAATTQLISKESLGRANGLVQFGQAASEISAPALAGSLVMSAWGGPKRRIDGVLYLDAERAVLPAHRATARALARRRRRIRRALDDCHHLWIEPGHLAEQGPAGRAGQGLCSPADDCSVHQAAGPPGRRAAGRPAVRAVARPWQWVGQKRGTDHLPILPPSASFTAAPFSDGQNRTRG